MARQSLDDGKANLEIGRLFESGEKVTTELVKENLVKIGVISDSLDAFHEFQLSQARDHLHRYRTIKAKARRIEEEPVNLFMFDEDGKKTAYWKTCGKLTPDEAAQHLRYWKNRISQDESKFARYYKFHMKKHKKKLQRLLDFGPPVEA